MTINTGMTLDRVEPSGGSGGCSWRGILRALLVGSLLAAYVGGFWGHFDGAWPGWVQAWGGWLLDATQEWYRAWLGWGAGGREQHRLHWLVVSVVFGGMLPILLARLMGMQWRETGLSGAGGWGWRVTVLGVLLTVPFAWLMAGERVADGWHWSRVDRLELWVGLGVSVPEHLLLTGVGLAWMMPGGRLRERLPLAEVVGRPWVRGLRWLGLAQPTDGQASRVGRVAAWVGLRKEQLPAVVMGGLVFGLVHVGARPIELAASFPGGVALCYLACRSRSIWPGWVIHVSQMALVAGMVWWRSG